MVYNFTLEQELSSELVSPCVVRYSVVKVQIVVVVQLEVTDYSQLSSPSRYCVGGSLWSIYRISHYDRECKHFFSYIHKFVVVSSLAGVLVAL